MENWEQAEDIENLLENIRINAINLSNYHRYRFFHFKSFGKYFRIPIIVLSSITSASSVGLQPFMSQGTISGMTCLLGFVIAVISSTEMYLKITDQQEKELALSKDYYSLGIDIFKLLATDRKNRSEDARAYLDKRYAEYKALTESSSLLKNDLRVDCLAQVPEEYNNSINPEKKSRSLFINNSPHNMPELNPVVPFKQLHDNVKPKPLDMRNISFSVDDKPINADQLSVSINTPTGSPRNHSKERKQYKEIKEELSIELAKVELAPAPAYANRKAILQKKVQIQEVMSPVRIPDETKEEPINDPIEEV